MKIVIEQLKGNKYIAYYDSEFLQASFTVIFKDNITGAIALNRFCQMIKEHSKEKENVSFHLTDKETEIQSSVVRDVLESKIPIAI